MIQTVLKCAWQISKKCTKKSFKYFCHFYLSICLWRDVQNIWNKKIIKKQNKIQNIRLKFFFKYNPNYTPFWHEQLNYMNSLSLSYLFYAFSAVWPLSISIFSFLIIPSGITSTFLPSITDYGVSHVLGGTSRRIELLNTFLYIFL